MLGHMIWPNARFSIVLGWNAVNHVLSSFGPNQNLYIFSEFSNNVFALHRVLNDNMLKKLALTSNIANYVLGAPAKAVDYSTWFTCCSMTCDIFYENDFCEEPKLEDQVSWTICKTSNHIWISTITFKGLMFIHNWCIIMKF